MNKLLIKNTIKGEIFVFIVSFVALLMGIISRIGFEYDNQHLLNSFFVITFLIFFPISSYVYLNKYHIHKWYLSKIFLLFIGFLFILLLSYLSKLFEINFIYIVYFLSIICLVYCLLKKYIEIKFNFFF